MSLQILKPGVLSTVQDLGRYGYASQGLSSGGAMDEQAFLWGNRLLGNAANSPQIEIALGGFSAIFLQATTLALTGAPMQARLNQRPLKTYNTYAVYPGDRLDLGYAREGLRSYLAVKNGFIVAPHFASCATVMRDKTGGLHRDGASLSAVDLLPYQACEQKINRSAPEDFLPEFSEQLQLRFIPNGSSAAISKQQLEEFIARTFTVSAKSDRMAIRFEGEALAACHNSEKLSHGVSLGAIQLPPDGLPIVLMRDKQTMGGYPQAGCVAYTDLAKLAQAKAGTRVKFVIAEIDKLEKELIDYQRFFGIH